MTFLAPMKKGQRGGHAVERVSATLIATKAGTIRLALAISKKLRAELGEPKRADVQQGAKEHAGMLIISFRDKGEFALTSASGGTMRVSIPTFDGVPDTHAIGALECEIVECSKTHLVVKLPLKAWKDAIGK